MTLRIDEPLNRLITQVSKHCGLSVSDIARRTLRWCLNHVEQLGNLNCSTANGPVLNIRGLELGSITPSQFRWALGYRCGETLETPPRNEFKTTLKLGVDYIVKQ